MDVPTYPKPQLVTDAAVNIAPTLEHKRDICQNAVNLLHLLGNERPSVAVLAAIETVNPKMSATIDAASPTAMPTRGQIVEDSRRAPTACACGLHRSHSPNQSPSALRESTDRDAFIKPTTA